MTIFTGIGAALTAALVAVYRERNEEKKRNETERATERKQMTDAWTAERQRLDDAWSADRERLEARIAELEKRLGVEVSCRIETAEKNTSWALTIMDKHQQSVAQLAALAEVVNRSTTRVGR